MRKENQARSTGESNEYDKLNQHVRDLQQRIATLTGAADKPLVGLLNVAFEELAATVEELRVAEEELRVQSEALEEAFLRAEVERLRYQDLFDSAPDALLVTNPQGVIEEANQAAAALLGLSPRLLRGKLFPSFIPREERPAFHQILLDLSKHLWQDEQEITIQPRRGPAMIVGATVASASGPGSEPLSLRWVIRDISRRRIAEAERYRLLVEGVHDYAVFMLDHEGQVTSWNPAAEQLLGFRPDEIIGRPGALIFTLEDRAAGAPEQELQTAASAGRAEDERWHLKKDGTRFWGSGVMTALLDRDGGITAYAKVMRDLTARHAEEASVAAELRKQRHTAQALQQAVLQPVPLEPLIGLEVAAFYEAAQQDAGLGGDFYDVFSLSEERVALIIGDVTGHGLDAARRTAEAKFAARAFLHQHQDPAQAIGVLNDYLCVKRRSEGSPSEVFLALALAVVDSGGKTTLITAGNEPPLILRADGTPVVSDERNTALGITPGVAYRASQVHLSPEDCLLLVTDGITEARNAAREFLDYEGMVRLAQAHRTERPEVMGQAILDEARTFAGGQLADDACLLLARRLPSG